MFGMTCRVFQHMVLSGGLLFDRTRHALQDHCMNLTNNADEYFCVLHIEAKRCVITAHHNS